MKIKKVESENSSSSQSKLNNLNISEKISSINSEVNYQSVDVKDNKSSSKNINLEKDDDLISDIKGPFRATSLNNCLMKNNIFLPSLTNRLKNNMPRFYRQNDGFLLQGIGKYSLKSFKTENNKNEYTNIDEEIFKNDKSIYETIKKINKNKLENIKRSISSELDKICNVNDLKLKFKKFLKQNNITAKELKISRIKKIKKF